MSDGYIPVTVDDREDKEKFEQADQAGTLEVSQGSTSHVTEIRGSSTLKDILGVTEEKQLLDALEAVKINIRADEKEIKLQYVPEIMRRNGDYEEYFKPRELSIGPIHAADARLFKKELKLHLAADFLAMVRANSDMENCPEMPFKDMKTVFQDFKIGIMCLESFFDKKVIESYTYEELTWLLFLDGCAMLGFINNYVNQQLNLFDISSSQAALIQQDLFLSENQIPFEVLHVLLKLNAFQAELLYIGNLRTFILLSHGTFPKDYTDDYTDARHNLIWQILFSGEHPIKPVHLLDLLRREFMACYSHPHRFGNPLTKTCNFFKLLYSGVVGLIHRGTETEMEHSNESVRLNWGDKNAFLSIQENTFRNIQVRNIQENTFPNMQVRNIQELQAAGINFKPTDSLREISFQSQFFVRGQLKLPTLRVDNWAPRLLLNMVAFEMCLPNPQKYDLNKYWVTSYVNLLDLLVDNEQDVKDLRAAGILRNHLSTDNEVAQMINKIGSCCFPPPKDTYEDVKNKIARHCRKRSTIWMAQVCRSHFSNPWTILALFVATAVLVLTATQTYYAVNPKS